MSITVLGSSAIASGGSYTPNSGTSNRLLVAIAYSVASPAVTLTHIAYNGVTRTPIVSNSWTSSVLELGVCLFVDSELSSSSATLTPTWSATPAGAGNIVCITLDGAFQSSSSQGGSAGPYQSTDTNSSSLAISGIASGDFVLGVGMNRGGATVTNTTSGWASLQQAVVSGGAAVYDASYHLASSTSDTYAISYSDGSDDVILSVLAIKAASGGGGSSPSQFFLSKNASGKAVLPSLAGALLAGIIERRERVPREEGWKQDKKSRLFLPTYRKRSRE